MKLLNNWKRALGWSVLLARVVSHGGLFISFNIISLALALVQLCGTRGISGRPPLAGEPCRYADVLVEDKVVDSYGRSRYAHARKDVTSPARPCKISGREAVLPSLAARTRPGRVPAGNGPAEHSGNPRSPLEWDLASTSPLLHTRKDEDKKDSAPRRQWTTIDEGARRLDRPRQHIRFDIYLLRERYVCLWLYVGGHRVCGAAKELGHLFFWGSPHLRRLTPSRLGKTLFGEKITWS